jgi:hypothetical protein
MSRKKHAWGAFFHNIENKSDDVSYKYQKSVEDAIIEDFMDNVYEELQELLNILEQAPNNDVKLGVLLAQESIRKSYYNE